MKISGQVVRTRHFSIEELTEDELGMIENSLRIIGQQEHTDGSNEHGKASLIFSRKVKAFAITFTSYAKQARENTL